MNSTRSGVSLLALVLLSACGDGTAPDGKGAAQDGAPVAGKSHPWYILAELPPESRPYGLDVYTAKCVQCHGDIGQGVDTHPPLKGISPTAMNKKLLDYRAGSIQGEKAAVMNKSLAGMSDAEIAAVALYAGD